MTTQTSLIQPWYSKIYVLLKKPYIISQHQSSSFDDELWWLFILDNSSCETCGTGSFPRSIHCPHTKLFYVPINKITQREIFNYATLKVWKCSGLIVGAFAFGLSGPGLSPGKWHSVVFLRKTPNGLLSYCLSPPRCIYGFWQTYFRG